MEENIRIINGNKFREVPLTCGDCPCWMNGATDNPHSVWHPVGFCILFDENHKWGTNIPRRCKKLFEKAFTFPPGIELLITKN